MPVIDMDKIIKNQNHLINDLKENLRGGSDIAEVIPIDDDTYFLLEDYMDDKKKVPEDLQAFIKKFSRDNVNIIVYDGKDQIIPKTVVNNLQGIFDLVQDQYNISIINLITYITDELIEY